MEEVFTPVVHLFMNLNIINPVSYKTPVKMSSGTKISWHFALFIVFFVIIPTPVQFATFFVAHCMGICDLLPDSSSCSCITLLTVFTQMQYDSNLRQPPRNKSLLRKNILLLISYT